MSNFVTIYMSSDYVQPLEFGCCNWWMWKKSIYRAHSVLDKCYLQTL